MHLYEYIKLECDTHTVQPTTTAIGSKKSRQGISEERFGRKKIKERGSIRFRIYTVYSKSSS